MQETQGMQVGSLGWEDPLEEEMATHFSILALRTSGTEKPSGLQLIGPQIVGHDWSNFTCMHGREKFSFSNCGDHRVRHDLVTQQQQQLKSSDTELRVSGVIVFCFVFKRHNCLFIFTFCHTPTVCETFVLWPGMERLSPLHWKVESYPLNH